MRNYIQLLFTALSLFLLFGCSNQTFSWKINTVNMEIAHIEAGPLSFRKIWLTGLKVLEFELTFSNKTSKTIYLYPRRLAK